MPITRDDIAGWILCCQPTVWDLDEVREQPDPVPFGLPRTYRRQLLEVDDPVLLWVGGGGSDAGLAATGLVTAPATVRVEPSLWRDGHRAQAPQPYADILLHFLPTPIPRDELRAAAGLAELELLRVPRATNPSFVRPDEMQVLRGLISRSRDAPV